MKLYWFKAQAPRRVLALLKSLGADAGAVETIELDMMKGALSTPEFTAMNPNKKAPVLVDGELTLWESNAIMAHLCIKAGSSMWPAREPAEQVEVLKWLSWNDCHWSPALGPFYFEHIVKPTFRIGEPNREALASKQKDLRKYAGILNAHLDGRDFVACSRLTIADFSLASMACHWREAEMPLQDLPHLVAWLDRLNELRAWREPWPPSQYAAK